MRVLILFLSLSGCRRPGCRGGWPRRPTRTPRSSGMLRDAISRLVIASVERQPAPPRRIGYTSAVMATLHELTMQVLLLLGIAWAAGFAAVAVSGPPEYRVPAGASLVLGLA